MDLFYTVATKKLQGVQERDVKIVFVGRREGLSKTLLGAIDRAEQLTSANTAGTLAVCINYGGRQEIADAIKAIIKAGVQARDVTRELVSRYIYAPYVPPVDLIIRTSGEQRTSGYMLWWSDYAELFFLEKHWPDVTPEDLDQVLEQYAKRIRRFGK